MAEKVILSDIDRLRYLMVYRSWFAYTLGILFFLGSVGTIFIIVEINSTGLVEFTPIVAVILVVIGVLSACALLWNFKTEWDMAKIRKKMIAEFLAEKKNEEDTTS